MFKEFHVRGQSDAYVRSFDEVVTEQPLLRETSAKHFVERPTIGDGLSVIDCFAKQVLIEVGNRLAVGVATARVRKQPRETRCRCRWEGDTHAWLNDCITTDTLAFIVREFHAVQRVRDRFDESPCSAVRKLRIGIERDHVTDPPRQRSGLHKVAALFAIQKTVEFLQFAAFSLPSDPAALALAPYPRSVEEKEGSLAVTCVELFYALHRQPKQIVIFRHLRFFCISEIRQQREMKVGAGVGQESYLQLLDLAADRVRCQQHHRDDDQSAAVVRYTLLKQHFWQHARGQNPGQPHLQQVNRKFAGWEERKCSPKQEHRRWNCFHSVRRVQEGACNSCGKGR